MPIITGSGSSSTYLQGRTVSQLLQSLRRYGGFDTDDPLIEWLNAAYHEFEDAYDWPFLETRDIVTVSAAPGEDAITGPTNLFKVIILKDLTNVNTLDYLPEIDLYRGINDLTSTGSPLYFTLTGSTIRLWPVPETAVTFDLVYQVQLPDLAATSDIPAIPARYHYGLIYGAAAIGLQAESEEDRAQAAETKFNEYIGRAISKLSSRRLGEPDTVSDAMGYGDD